MYKELSGEKLIEAAAAIAERVHAGQEHHFGTGSYFDMHLIPVAGIVRRLGYGPKCIAGAYLHDAPEDTSITDDEMLAEGIPFDVVHATHLMEKKGEDHSLYLGKILTSTIATVDKFADSSFNFSWTILNSPTIHDEKYVKRVLEYSHNVHVLQPHLPPRQEM